MYKTHKKRGGGDNKQEVEEDDDQGDDAEQGEDGEQEEDEDDRVTGALEHVDSTLEKFDPAWTDSLLLLTAQHLRCSRATIVSGLFVSTWGFCTSLWKGRTRHGIE
jgi:hypothetical protein